MNGFIDAEDARRFLIAVERRASASRRASSGFAALSNRSRQPLHSRQEGLDRERTGGSPSSAPHRHHSFCTDFGLDVQIPKTVVIGTAEFERLVRTMDTTELMKLESNEAITREFARHELSADLVRDLWATFDALEGPLAVRSSSLLEDSRFRPFAGIYATYMLPNNDPDPMVRFSELSRAILAVYSSAFWKEARSYLASTAHAHEDELMAIVVQKVVGRSYADRFYPQLSGVARSHDYYALDPRNMDDGVAEVALGLGHTVVSGGVSLRFSPASPSSLPQFATPRSFLQHSQRKFIAIDLSRSVVDFARGPEATLAVHGLEVAEADGALAIAGSVYSAQDDVIRENLALPGPRIVTFNNILKWNLVPLAPALLELLRLLRDAMGTEVEIEFALDISSNDGGDHGTPQLYILQLLPTGGPEQLGANVELDPFEDEQCPAKRRPLGRAS